MLQFDFVCALSSAFNKTLLRRTVMIVWFQRTVEVQVESTVMARALHKRANLVCRIMSGNDIVVHPVSSRCYPGSCHLSPVAKRLFSCNITNTKGIAALFLFPFNCYSAVGKISLFPGLQSHQWEQVNLHLLPDPSYIYVSAFHGPLPAFLWLLSPSIHCFILSWHLFWLPSLSSSGFSDT